MDPLETLYEALQHPLGLVISVENPVAFRTKLYTTMRQNADVNVFSIHISRTAPSTELVILRKETSDGL